jgi:hypothetical protein
MADLALFFGSVILMAGASHWLLKAITTNVTFESLSTGYSRRAIRISRKYKLTAWGLLTALLLAHTLYYFTLVFLRF